MRRNRDTIWLHYVVGNYVTNSRTLILYFAINRQLG